jgi:hypothetical protein
LPQQLVAEQPRRYVAVDRTAVSKSRVPKDGNSIFFPMYLAPYAHRRLPDPTYRALQFDASQINAADFFSRYEPHFRYTVLHFGGEAALRALLARAGVPIDDDVQIAGQYADDANWSVALFRHEAAAKKLDLVVLPTDEAVHCVNRLSRDAHIASSKALFPRRPTVPFLPANATPVEVIDAVLGRSLGMVVGEAHHAIASKRFLIDHMAVLQSHGVQTLFMEHLLSDDHQVALDAWHASPPGSAMPSTIAAYLRDQDCGHMSEHCVDTASRSRYRHLKELYCFTAVAKAAQRCGIKIVAADCHASYGVHVSGVGGTAESEHTRTEVMNYFASEKIQRCELPRKWVALVGNTHVNTYQGVPGIAEQTGTLAVVVKDRINRGDAPAFETWVKDFSPGMHLDMVVAMDWD